MYSPMGRPQQLHAKFLIFLSFQALFVPRDIQNVDFYIVSAILVC